MTVKLVSLILACVLVTVVFFTGKAGDWVGAFVLAVVSLLFIWFGDEIGDYTGFAHGIPMRRSPGGFIRFAGWALLLAPLIAGLLSWMGYVQR